jgi:DNA helicase-2/ATP-dependent DNA helicase PcrA
VDLTAERFDARQIARRGTFTGKTYNSVSNISQFFEQRGIPFGAPKTVSAAAPPQPRPPVPSKPLPAAAPPVRRGARAGMVVEHPKYGTGTVVRREGDGDNAKITVNFPRYGLKKLVEKYAGLKRNG